MHTAHAHADARCVRRQAIAPNLTTVVGELVGARLIAHAGSLMNLAKQPASTVQILGAEKVRHCPPSPHRHQRAARPLAAPPEIRHLHSTPPHAAPTPPRHLTHSPGR